MLFSYYNSKRDTPLSLRWETRHHWKVLQEAFGVTETGAAIMLSLFGVNGRVSYSRNKNHYNQLKRYKERLYTYVKIIGQIELLDQLGLIQNHCKALPGARHWQSTFEASPKLIEFLENHFTMYGKLVPSSPKETVILRAADKALLDYKETREIAQMRLQLEHFNAAMRSADVEGATVSTFVRIFNQDFNRGGRFYVRGDSFQNMRKVLRKEIKINGETTVEIDYKTLHPSLLYAMANCALPDDSYDVGSFNRPLVKQALLTLINAKSESDALHSLARHQLVSFGRSQGRKDDYALAKTLIDELKRVHHPISQFFHADMGAKLMRIDSDMAEAVMHMMYKQNILVLPIHDSFLVQSSKRETLEEAMAQAAHKVGFPEIKTEIA